MRYKFIDCIECSPASEANIFSAKKIPLFYALRTFTTIFYSNIYSTRCNVIQFILPGRCSTCFGWYLHPSSGAQTNVSTAYGICHTVTATCCYRGRVGTGLSVLWVACNGIALPLYCPSLLILIMKGNEMHYFSNLFDKVLYMFRTGLLSIIR